MQPVASWGNAVRAEHTLVSITSRHEAFPDVASAPSVLPFGNGRSYGDSCLNPGGMLLKTRALDRFMQFDRETGRLSCEAGVLLSEILALAVPAGWFPPVTPGTAFVTVGGAIANDVHGKNHHRVGTFGGYVRRFELLRSNGQRLMCSPHENPGLFAATIGGLGLTGVITWAELQLRAIDGPWMDLEVLRMPDLATFFRLASESDAGFEYTVAWIDCLARGKSLGRGIFQRANHSSSRVTVPPRRERKLRVPFTPPVSLVNAVSLRLFNTLYYHRSPTSRRTLLQHYERFFYPLDGILDWNRVYGPRGFYQYQCLLPLANGEAGVAQLLEAISRSGLGSFLAVLKVCGAVASPGMLSFPAPGVTLALDFPNHGARLERLFTALDCIVAKAGGRLYPAKDGRMPAELFRSGYPRWQEFAQHVDPRCSSSFWRRVTESEPA